MTNSNPATGLTRLANKLRRSFDLLEARAGEQSDRRVVDAAYAAYLALREAGSVSPDSEHGERIADRAIRSAVDDMAELAEMTIGLSNVIKARAEENKKDAKRLLPAVVEMSEQESEELLFIAAADEDNRRRAVAARLLAERSESSGSLS